MLTVASLYDWSDLFQIWEGMEEEAGTMDERLNELQGLIANEDDKFAKWKVKQWIFFQEKAFFLWEAKHTSASQLHSIFIGIAKKDGI